MIHGRLYYMMGPAGAGKSGVLGWVREHGVPVGVVCAQRYMTRAARDGSESLVTLSDEEFTAREQRGLFALTWSAHGVRYGIGREIEHWMNRGADVLVNGSRGAYAEALKRFPNLQPVVITAHAATLSAQPAVRDVTSAMPSGALVIHNDGYPAHAGSQLLDAIRMHHAG
jgi:ribose 1,5-bisphosphokinase